MLIIASPILSTTNCSWKGRGHCHVTSLTFGKIGDISKTVQYSLIVSIKFEHEVVRMLSILYRMVMLPMTLGWPPNPARRDCSQLMDVSSAILWCSLVTGYWCLTSLNIAEMMLSAMSLVFIVRRSASHVMQACWLTRPAACKKVWNALRVFKRMIAISFSGFVTLPVHVSRMLVTWISYANINTCALYFLMTNLYFQQI